MNATYASPPAFPPPDFPGTDGGPSAFTVAIVKVLGVQVVGYVLKAANMLGPSLEAGLGNYVGLVALPCLLFRVTATLSIQDINPMIILSLLLAKTLMLLVAGVLGVLLTKRSGEGALLLGGVTAIFIIISDDLGVGYSVFDAVFTKQVVSSLFVMCCK